MVTKEELLIKHMDKRFEDLENRLDKLDLKIDVLNAFRLKIIGIIIGLVGLAETVRFIIGG